MSDCARRWAARQARKIQSEDWQVILQEMYRKRLNEEEAERERKRCRGDIRKPWWAKQKKKPSWLKGWVVIWTAWICPGIGLWTKGQRAGTFALGTHQLGLAGF